MSSNPATSNPAPSSSGNSLLDIDFGGASTNTPQPASHGSFGSSNALGGFDFASNQPQGSVQQQGMGGFNGDPFANPSASSNSFGQQSGTSNSFDFMSSGQPQTNPTSNFDFGGQNSQSMGGNSFGFDSQPQSYNSFGEGSIQQGMGGFNGDPFGNPSASSNSFGQQSGGNMFGNNSSGSSLFDSLTGGNKPPSSAPVHQPRASLFDDPTPPTQSVSTPNPSTNNTSPHGSFGSQNNFGGGLITPQGSNNQGMMGMNNQMQPQGMGMNNQGMMGMNQGGFVQNSGVQSQGMNNQGMMGMNNQMQPQSMGMNSQGMNNQGMMGMNNQMQPQGMNVSQPSPQPTVEQLNFMQQQFIEKLKTLPTAQQQQMSAQYQQWNSSQRSQFLLQNFGPKPQQPVNTNPQPMFNQPQQTQQPQQKGKYANSKY